MKKLSTLLLLLFATVWGTSQVVINEFQVDNNTVELKNVGTTTIDISGWFLCSFPTYSALGSLTLNGGDLIMEPGEIIYVEGHSMGPDDELALYNMPSYSSSTAIEDYIEWGSAGHQRASVAEAAGIWTIGDFLATPVDGVPYAYDGEGDTVNDWIAQDPTFGEENFGGCDVVGGMITTQDATEICVGDGNPDPINVMLSGNAGENSAWVITNEAGEILGLPEGSPFDLEGAGEGVCLIWHLSFSGAITGAEVGLNANDLEGCFELSNSITVTRTAVSGGTITTQDPLDICVGDGVADPINVALSGNEGENSAWVITNEAGEILGLPEGSPFDLEGAGAGVCLIWHLSFNGELTGAEVGNNASDLGGCLALSNPITVVRTAVAGGTISTEDALEICAGDGVADPINVTLVDNEGENSAWVITNEAGEILGLPEGSPFDLEGAGEGVCLIWHLSFNGALTGAEVGNNASDLGGCLALSNPITVIRTGVAGGTISTQDPLVICADDEIANPINVTLEGNEGTNSAWVITNEAGEILGLPAGSPFDLEGAGAGVCLIWHLSFEDGLTGAEVGMNASDLGGCFSLSNPISVTRLTGEDCDCLAVGGTISTEDSTDLCVGDGAADPINVTLDGAFGTNSAWVITDVDGSILDLPAGSPFDLEGAGEGVCLIWHLSFEDGLTGAEVGANASDLEGCFSLSNPIEVVRTEVAGGTISTKDATEICVSDGVADPINVTLEGNQGTNSAWVITNEAGEILDLPAGSPFNLDGAGEGVCLIWHLSFEDGIIGAQVGMNADELEGCFSLSNPITVTRTEINGGTVSTTDGESTVTITVGDEIADLIEFESTGNLGTNYTFIVTDSDDNILEVLDGNSNDFEGADPGVCHLWGLAHEGELIFPLDGTADVISAEGCFQLSANFVTIDRQPVGVYEFIAGSFNVWPNPTAGNLTIELPTGVSQANLSVYSTTGALVAAIPVNGTNSAAISVAELKAGAYVLVLTTENGTALRQTLLKK